MVEMRFLVDQSVSRRVAQSLVQAGHEADHVAERGLFAARDEEILELACSEKRVVVTQDSDFGTLLAFSRAQSPSVVLIRKSDGRPATHVRLLLDHLPSIADDLIAGAIVVFGERTIRVRRLPLVAREV